MNASLKALLNGVKTIAVTCLQFGDTGKGKFVDLLAHDWADIVARGTGGANAGHTINAGERKLVTHLVPSGIMCPGKINIVGNGVVLDPRQFVREIAAVRKLGIDCDGRLFVAHNAKLVLPQHIVLDKMSDLSAGNGKIGTTGRGIGPAYVDHYKRTGLTVNDLLNPDTFRKKLVRNLEDAKRLIRGYGEPENIVRIMREPALDNGAFYSLAEMFDTDAIIASYLAAGKEFESMIADTDSMMREAVGKKNVLLEGAQGLFLSIDEGTYPYVTSSDCSDQGLAKGGGLKHGDIGLSLGIVKAFCMTRVGGGPFPTEMGGEPSAEWCDKVAAESAQAQGFTSVRDMEMELKRFGSYGLDEQDEFKLGVAARIAGDEYGATTGRPRRTGWLDLPLLRRAVEVTGIRNVILTKLDVMGQCPMIKVCIAYEYVGPDYRVGKRTLRSGDKLETAIPDVFVLKHCRPIYREFPGWMSCITGAKTEQDLPTKLLEIIRFVEQSTETKARILSVGPDRESTIFRA